MSNFATADAGELLAEFASAGPTQSTIQVGQWLSEDELTLSIDGPADEILAALEDLDSVEWAAPTFVNAQSGQRQWISDEVVVVLERGVDPAAFFAGDTFSGYRPLLGTADEFVGTVAAGGSETLDVAGDLARDPRVAWSAARFL